MGDFPEDFQVDTWRLIQLWIAEGFIRTSSGSRKSLEEVAKKYLEDLISRNLIMARKKRFNGEVKVCGIHDLLREFCLIEAEMTKFMHVVRTPLLPAQKSNFRRFSIQEDYSVEDSYKLLPPVARSMYCFSCLDLPFEPRIKLLHILPIYRHDPIIHGFFSCFNHLRVLAIFPSSFSTFPLVITKLFHLRYLQVGCFGNIPESISELLNLQTLICDGNPSDITLPRKIWMLKNLRKKCKDLQEIPTDFVEICTLESIELHDCTTTAEDSVRNIEQEREDMGYNILKVYIHNSHRN
ncbi:hypothetical protein KY289_027419 [Solanum tuberosum]|nr:hypothetical protein KY289_027419 [Solanum tuberosum]